MKKFVSLKKNEDFGRAYRRGKSYGSSIAVMYYFERGQDLESRVGISVSKKVGNSVVRHRLKRQIRECFRTHLDRWKDGYDIVVVARQGMKDADFASIDSTLTRLGNKLGINIQ